MGLGRDYPEMIPLLKGAGKFVICYFNAGALQSWNKDIKQFPKAVIGHSLAYPYDSEEWYLDIRDLTVLELQKARLDVAAKIGCDAVDPDNVDAWQQDGEDPTGFRLKPSDYTKYLKNLAETLSQPLTSRFLSLAAALRILTRRTGHSVRDFQAYIDAGKPVLQIEYPHSVEKTGKLSSSDNTYYCTPKDEDKGFSKILKWASAQLDGWSQFCGDDPFRTPVIKE
ncbi:hypothetical protein FVER14953_01488 [Fusarium verticillioides]|nr:hypothetical protein FVER14953_01488 [Fusarium verticillioides]